MQQGGWSFSWNDGFIFWPGDQFCGDFYTVPSTSYCGFQYPGDGEISYTFTSSGTADLRYGQSWYGGSVHVRKNEEEIDSISTMGTSDITFEFSPGDVLTIYELGDSVINIHSLTLTQSGKEKIKTFFKIINIISFV